MITLGRSISEGLRYDGDDIWDTRKLMFIPSFVTYSMNTIDKTSLVMLEYINGNIKSVDFTLNMTYCCVILMEKHSSPRLSYLYIVDEATKAWISQTLSSLSKQESELLR